MRGATTSKISRTWCTNGLWIAWGRGILMLFLSGAGEVDGRAFPTA